MAFVYYMDDLEESGNIEKLNKLIESKRAILVDDKVFSKEIINNVDPAYKSIKELIPWIYEGYTLEISADNNLYVDYCDIIKFLDKIWQENTEDDIFDSEDPENTINNLIRECTIEEINRRLDEIKSDFLKTENGIKCNKIGWNSI